nr:unnamed protein product [Callosobruchus chinensis]
MTEATLAEPVPIPVPLPEAQGLALLSEMPTLNGEVFVTTIYATAEKLKNLRDLVLQQKKFEEQLRFLEKSIAMRPTVSTISEESQSSQQNAEDDTENSGPEESEDGQQAVGTITTPTTSKSAPIKRTKKIGIEEHLLNFMEAHKPKNAHQPIVEDDDLAFFFSLLPMETKLLIESRISYACTVYGSVRKSKLQELEKIQLMALRAATGAIRTSPTVSVLCDTSVMPLRLKIGKHNNVKLMYQSSLRICTDVLPKLLC